MRILGFTSSRADYDLLSPLYKLLNDDDTIEFKLIVSGTHLSHEYGYSKNEIIKDNFDVLIEIENLLIYDNKKSKLKTASILLNSIIDVVDMFKPDLLLYAGDREDVIMYGLLSVFLEVPSIHFYGGDHEMGGHEDTIIRHATSKLSTFHFVSCEEHKQRLIKLGENVNRIYNIGALSLDKFFNYTHIKKQELYKKFNLISNKDFALVIYHPSPNKEENEKGDLVLTNIIENIKSKNLLVFVSAPNSDEGNKKLFKIIEMYNNDNDVIFFKNLKRDEFLSLFKECKFLIGNSSAGIYEAATIKKGVINVGERQKNRLCSENVIFCDVEYNSISKAIDIVLSKEFQYKLKNIKNIYGYGNSAYKAYKLIKSINFKKMIIKSEDPLNKKEIL